MYWYGQRDVAKLTGDGWRVLSLPDAGWHVEQVVGDSAGRVWIVAKRRDDAATDKPEERLYTTGAVEDVFTCDDAALKGLPDFPPE